MVVGGLSSWLITIESSDWAGATSVDRLSENGEAIALTINDTMLHYSLFYARDGDLQCRLRWLDGPAGDITFLERHLTDLPMMLDTVPASEEDSERNASQVSSDVWKVYAFMLAERITGVRLTADWLDREHTRYLRISNR
ncbi:hypothetical protein C1J01_41555 [Nonomuraea aridisoli]|uniref:Uncharacterized protein n=1 Tax=Nonomuraea aridisoli TaxID=2070368 RepID=A0A2W2D870_9ACTN|nr:hypothetical protein C1J01_41555 [Nonomuraea aridisoli]